MTSINNERNILLAFALLTHRTLAQENADAASETPTECNYGDSSLGDYLACNKAKYTTTQLVGAGIGVTLVIFLLCFGVLHFVRRKKNGPKSKQSRNDEEKVKRAGGGSDGEYEEADEEVMTDDEKDRKHKQKHQREGPRRSRSRDRESDLSESDDSKPPKYSRAVKSEDAETTDDDSPPARRDTHKALPAAPKGRADDRRLRPSSRHAPTSTGSARIGSPVEPTVRKLYPSNPDPSEPGRTRRNTLRPPTESDTERSRRNTLRPPGELPRPRSSVERPLRENDLKPPMPVARSSTTKSPKAATPPKPTAAPVRPRPVTQDTPARPESDIQPPSRPQPATRSSSMYSTDTTQSDYRDMPLPAPPHPARTSSRASSTYLPSRSSSRQSTLNGDVPDVPKARVGTAPVRQSVRESRHPSQMRGASMAASVHEEDEREERASR